MISTNLAILAHHYTTFIRKSGFSSGPDPRNYSSHSFRRGSASYAFNHSATTEFIKAHEDWLSDAYLVYLSMSNEDKFKSSTPSPPNFNTNINTYFSLALGCLSF